MSLHDVVQPPPSPPPPQSPPSDHHLRGPLHEEISSPINAQIFDFCNPDIFSDTLQNTEATSTSPNGCGFHEDHNYSIEPLDIGKFLRDDQNEQNTSATSSTATTATTVTTPDQFQHQSVDGLSIIFDSSKDDIDDISASIDFSPSSPFSGLTPPPNYNINYNHPTNNYNMTNQHEYQYQLHINDVTGMISSYPTSIEHAAAAMLPLVSGPPPPGPAPLGTVYEEDCFSPSMLPFLRINPTSNSSSSSSCSFLDPSNIGSCLPGNLNHGLAGAENSGLFPRSLLMGSELQAKEMDFQGDNAGIFCPDHQLPRAPYNSGDKQGFSSESSQLVSSATSSSAPLTTEMSNLEDSSFKVGKLSAEQRKEKIHRYLKKRNERNFSKKIKYACRKTLADSRPRVRGRFAKNDDFVDTHRHNINGHHEDDDYDDVAVKEEHDMVDSSDILTHISGVNSFKCNFQIQSWM